MKKLLGIVLLALLCACAHPAPPSAPKPAPQKTTATELARKTVALVHFDEEGGAHAYCSGVWIGPKRILTAAHCVQKNPLASLFGLPDPAIRYAVRTDIFLDGRNEAKYPTTREAFRVRVDEDLDLGLLSTDDAPDHESASIAAGPIVQASFAQTMGHPKGLWWSYSSGSVAAERQMSGVLEMPIWWIQTDAAISPGNSGCGLFNAEGNLIGIASWVLRARGSEGLAFFVHRDHIAAFLKAAS